LLADKTSERRLGFFSNFLNWATASKPVVITLLIVGKTQVGKSSFIKRIYGELNKSQEKVDIAIGGEGESVTTDISYFTIKSSEKDKFQAEINLIDTPGLYDTHGVPNEAVMVRITQRLKEKQLVPDVVLFTSRFTTNTLDQAEQKLVQKFIHWVDQQPRKPGFGVLLPYAGPNIDTFANMQGASDRDRWVHNLEILDKSYAKLLGRRVPLFPVDNRPGVVTLPDGRNWVSGFFTGLRQNLGLTHVQQGCCTLVGLTIAEPPKASGAVKSDKDESKVVSPSSASPSSSPAKVADSEKAADST